MLWRCGHLAYTALFQERVNIMWIIIFLIVCLGIGISETIQCNDDFKNTKE